MRVLGIDPGYERLGIAVLEYGIHGKKDTLLFSECFKTSAQESFEKRLAMLGEKIEMLFKKFSPEYLAIETLFFTNNQKTAMRVAEARGVILYHAGRFGAEVHEITPPEIKLATTGHGKSDKKQIIAMIPRLVEVKKDIEHDDEYDAIAVAITHSATNRSRILGSKK